MIVNSETHEQQNLKRTAALASEVPVPRQVVTCYQGPPPCFLRSLFYPDRGGYQLVVAILHLLSLLQHYPLSLDPS